MNGDLPIIIGESRQIREVRAAIEKFAALPVPVIIYGESGTGKELFARLLHQLSPRRNRPFVVVDSGAIPEALIETELFGYVGGAFTDALRGGKRGLWGVANGGTLFLDEIADLPLVAQVKVLRVLQEQVIRPVGGTEDMPVDVRVIAATNVNLLNGVQAGRFRLDLYYRLHILHITIAPLRERQEDILLILDHLIRKLCVEFHLGKPPTISQDAREKLLGYSWPGNVRELENVVMRTLSLHTGATELHADNFELLESAVEIPPDMLPMLIKKGSFVHMRIQAEDAMIRWALNVTEGNQTAAARLLGVHRNTLITKGKYRLPDYKDSP
jgi:transcriptional regulator with PAS, ATPase and Fis domain